MLRTFRRYARGEWPVDLEPPGHRKTILRARSAPEWRDGAELSRRGNDREEILTCVERGLAQTLERNDIVLIDNLPAHKAGGVRKAVEACGATLRYLPQHLFPHNLTQPASYTFHLWLFEHIVMTTLDLDDTESPRY